MLSKTLLRSTRLATLKRPMVSQVRMFSAPPNFDASPSEAAAPKVGNSWRTTGDISDDWQQMKSNITHEV